MFFFGAAPVVVFRTVDGFAAGVLDSEPPTSGDLGRSVPLLLTPGLRKGDPIFGVPVRDGGFEGRLIVGLSQEEKKSSSSPAGVLLPSLLISGTSVITTSPGYLAQLYQQTSCASQRRDIHPGVRSASPSQFFLVLCRGVAGVFGLVVFARERSRAAVGLEVLGCALVATDLHDA